MPTREVSTDKNTTYAVENAIFEDTEETANKFFIEIVEGSENVTNLPEISDAIKINFV